MISRKLAVLCGCVAVLECCMVIVTIVGIGLYIPTLVDLWQTPVSIDEDKVENLLRQKAQAHLAVAENEAEAAMAKRLEAVRCAFDRAYVGATPFAESATSWAARWSLLKDTVGIGENDAHKQFLAESFGKHVFSNADLKAALEGAVAGYISDLKAIESRMLVNLRADVADSALAERLGTSLQSDEAFREAYDRVQLDDTLMKESGVFLASNAASWAAADLATPIALRLLISAAGALGVNPASFSSGGSYVVATLAVGAMVGVIADYIIAAVLKLVGYDPQADIVKEVRTSLSTLEKAIFGQPEKPGLEKELKRICAERAAIREKAVLAVFSEGGAK